MNLWQLKRTIHPSWLIAVGAVGVVVGVVLAGSSRYYLTSPIWLVIGLAIIALVLWRRTAYMIPLIILAGLLIGFWRGSAVQSNLATYDKLIGSEALVVGRVSEDPDYGKQHDMQLRLHDISIDGHPVSGAIWMTMSNDYGIKRGDYVHAQGTLSDGFGTFSASVYRAEVKTVQRPTPGDIAGRVRDWFAKGIRSAIDEPEASLGIGYLVGQRRALPPELDEALLIAGLTHIVVASGYNLTILVRLARRLFMKVSKYLAALSAGSMIVTFVAITGMSPSMSRAALVAGLSLLAWYYGRKFHPLVLLPFAAAVTLLINPSFGWNDLGWQLSFAAFFGVMVMAPLLQAYFFGNEKPSMIRQILGETISAQICTLPIIIAAFGVFSNVAVIANLLILPLVPFAMLLTFIAGVGAIVIPSWASFFGAPSEWLLGYMVKVTEYLAGLSWAQTELTINGALVIISYAIIAGLCVYLWKKSGYSLRNSNIVE